MSDMFTWASEQEEAEIWRRYQKLKEQNDVPGDKRPTLEKYNSQENELHKQMTEYPKPNGILCDQCHAELFDINGVIIEVTLRGYTSNYYIESIAPGVIEVECKCCSFKGTRVA
jgi:hypothetical protein